MEAEKYKNKVVIYHAIFTTLDDGILVSFPDYNYAGTDGENFKEAFAMAVDLLELMYMYNEECGIPQPNSLNPEDVKLEKNQQLIGIPISLETAYENYVSNNNL